MDTGLIHPRSLFLSKFPERTNGPTLLEGKLLENGICEHASGDAEELQPCIVGKLAKNN